MEAAKREWELGRLQGLKEQEEREAELEEDDVLYTYSREDSENQVHKSSKNTKRKEKSKGTGGEKGVRETRQTRRDSREKSRRASGSKEGSRTSSRGGSPPPVERQSRRVRSRASSGASGTDGDLSRRTRSRTSSGSGSDRLPSPRGGGDRAVRMAEREKRRDTPHLDTSHKDSSHKDSPRPVGRPRIRSADSAKTPERILPKRKSSGSDPGVESKGKLRSSDRRSIFSNLKTRSRRRPRRSGSVSEGSKVSGNLEPVVETSSVRIDVAEESSEQNNHIAGQSQDKSHTENMNHDQSASKDVEKRTRNIFDIVDTTMRIKERIKDAIRPASQGGTVVGNVLEKINTRNLFADLAKKFKKKNAPEISLPTHEENASDIRSSSETASINHHSVTDSANEIESSTVDEPLGEQELVTENNDEAKMLIDSPKDNESIVNECITDETTPDVISVDKSQPAAAIEEVPVRIVPEDKETIPDVISIDKSPSPQPTAATEEVLVRIVPEDKDGKQNEDDIANVVEPERTLQNSGVTPKASEVPEMDSGSTEMADEPEEPKGENIMDQDMANIEAISPTPASLVESKDVGPLDANVMLGCEEENTQDTEMEVVVDYAQITAEDDMKEKEVTPVVEEEIQTDSNVDQTLHTENEIPDSASHPTLRDNQDLATQNVVEEEKHTDVEKLDEASTSKVPDVLTEYSNNTAEEATESVKEVEPVEEEKPMPVLSAESLVNVEKAELPQTVEKMPEIVVSSPYIRLDSISPAAKPVSDTKDNSSKQAIEETVVSNVGMNDDKAGEHCDHPDEDVMEVDIEQEVKEVVVDNKHEDETVQKPTENISESEVDKAKEHSDKGEEQDNKDKEQGSTSDISMLKNRVFVRIPLLDLSKINRDDEDGRNQGESTTSVEGSEDESSSKVDYNEEGEEQNIELSLPPKPTRRIREILNLTLPGEKPLNLDIDTPAARTRSRNTGDTVRTRSRVKPSSSPNVGGVSTPLRASPRSGGRGSAKKTPEPSSVIGAKRSPRPANSDSGAQSSMKRTLRSSDVS